MDSGNMEHRFEKYEDIEDDAVFSLLREIFNSDGTERISSFDKKTNPSDLKDYYISKLLCNDVKSEKKQAFFVKCKGYRVLNNTSNPAYVELLDKEEKSIKRLQIPINEDLVSFLRRYIKIGEVNAQQSQEKKSEPNSSIEENSYDGIIKKLSETRKVIEDILKTLQNKEK